MQYSFRLAEILNHDHDPKKRPGTIKAIVEHTGLDRHQVAALLKNEVKYIPLKALSRICDYLIENNFASASQLPGILFSVEPENFWEMLARRTRLEMCLGVRRDTENDESGLAFLSASDSVMMGEILNGVTTLGGTTKHRKQTDSPGDTDAANMAFDPNKLRVYNPHPEVIKQSLVWSPGQESTTKISVQSRANEVYNTFSDTPGDKALICLGSIKSNPVGEIILANTFGCEPFVSNDDVADPKERACPFFLRFRDNDPQPDSFFAGKKLCKGDQKKKAGIYYEDAGGNWILANEDNDPQYVAFLFYIHRESWGRLELALGGFSGKATRALAKVLSKRAEDFWPPVIEEGGIRIGAFIVEFQDEGAASDDEILQTDINANSRIVPIPAEAIERRLKKQR